MRRLEACVAGLSAMARSANRLTISCWSEALTAYARDTEMGGTWNALDQTIPKDSHFTPPMDCD